MAESDMWILRGPSDILQFPDFSPFALFQNMPRDIACRRWGAKFYYLQPSCNNRGEIVTVILITPVALRESIHIKIQDALSTNGIFRKNP